MKSLSSLITSLLLMISALLAHSAWAQCNGESWTPDNRFKINGSEVLDTKTNLIWRRCAEGMSWDGATCEGKPVEITWADAMVRYQLDNINWRVPNWVELKTLRSGTEFGDEDAGEKSKTGCWSPAVNTAIFPGEQASIFWSAMDVGGYSDFAWFVSFDNGLAFFAEKRGRNNVRLVRAGQRLIP